MVLNTCFILWVRPRVIVTIALNVKADKVRNSKKNVVLEYVLGTLYQCFTILSVSSTTITTGQSRVSPGTENISNLVSIHWYFNFTNKLLIFSFYLNIFQIDLVKRLASLMFRNISNLILCNLSYHQTALCVPPMLYAPQIENHCFRWWEVCCTVWQQQNYSALCKFLHTYYAVLTVSSSALFINVR